MLKLDAHDETLVATVKDTLRNAISAAHNRVVVVKRIVTFAVGYRNRGRADAKRRHPSVGICEESRLPLDRIDAVFDEMEPELGYAGRCRWVCAKHNNSGRRSCKGVKTQ